MRSLSSSVLSTSSRKTTSALMVETQSRSRRFARAHDDAGRMRRARSPAPGRASRRRRRSARRRPRAPAAGRIRQRRRDDRRARGSTTRPRRLDRVLAREERAVAGHRVAEQPLVRSCSSPCTVVAQVELALLADEAVARPLDARGERDRRARLQLEANVVGARRRRPANRRTAAAAAASGARAPRPRSSAGACRRAGTTARRPSATSR